MAKRKSRLKKKYKFSYSNISIIMLFLLMSYIVINYFPNTYSKYQSTLNSKSQTDYSAYIIKEGYEYIDINLDSIIPSDTPYYYTFSISNYDEEEKLTDIKIEYDLSVITTTNLPLTYNLYMNNEGSVVKENIVEQDDYGTYFRYLKTNTEEFGYDEKEKNTYTLEVTFPEIYVNNSEYQDIIESVTVKIESRQKIN